MKRGWLYTSIAFVCAAASAHASLLTIESRQTAFAVICTGGVAPGFCAGGTTSQVDTSSVDGVSHANNFDGNLTTPSEARTAGRSGPTEIAANATLRHRNGGPFQNYTDIYGDALYEWDVLVLNEGDVFFNFHLPPGFVEYQANAEFVNILELTAAIQADIAYCSPACSYSPANSLLFQMHSTIEGTYQDYELTNGAFSVNPSLDTSPLTHTTVTDTGPMAFIRTRTWEYDPFEGRIPLGHFVGGQTFSLSYRLRAEVFSEFSGFQTWAAAAINDPFFLESDQLPQQILGSFEFVASTSQVPEPSTVWLAGAGLGLIAVARLSRRRPGRE